DMTSRRLMGLTPRPRIPDEVQQVGWNSPATSALLRRRRGGRDIVAPKLVPGRSSPVRGKAPLPPASVHEAGAFLYLAPLMVARSPVAAAVAYPARRRCRSPPAGALACATAPPCCDTTP